VYATVVRATCKEDHATTKLKDIFVSGGSHIVTVLKGARARVRLPTAIENGKLKAYVTTQTPPLMYHPYNPYHRAEFYLDELDVLHNAPKVEW